MPTGHIDQRLKQLYCRCPLCDFSGVSSILLVVALHDMLATTRIASWAPAG